MMASGGNIDPPPDAVYRGYGRVTQTKPSDEIGDVYESESHYYIKLRDGRLAHKPKNDGVKFIQEA